MRKYEVMVLIDSDVDERQVPGLIEKHLETITKEGGVVDNTDIWGRRKLAYDINKKSEAIYVVLQLTCEPATVAEMDRLMSIDEKVVRTKVLRRED
ncbi:30S ribosomal protein S6 [Tessaracoccus sp. OH4464_COT-324]|uniref:30S ribosomal protein S6 n=1 Tax=Tessaracoccus sp. OH4464_COT-324 TaxID=2491059 RepID=UPI000F63A31F|nr:30S ribosomal protein S6 [Tessaracoccus sp. OH4464_COT-324]RRD45240.1 30S ribosomal protein S6 [Tessaracoccus sp. OH4464_COT-324]